MRAAQLVAPQVFEVRDVEVPEPGPGQVLVRVAGAGMCHSDVHIVHSPVSLFPTLPMTLGHETAGHVAARGPGVTGLDVGSAVLVVGIWGCMTCPACVQGRMNACQTWARLAPVPAGPGLGFPGGMAEYLVAPATGVYPIGDLDPVAAAPLGDAALTPCHAVNLARPVLIPGSTVAVLGVGGLGHMALQILRATTAARIVALDVDRSRLEAALGYGADLAIPSDDDALAALTDLTDGLGVDAVLDFVGVDATLRLASRATATYGTIVVVGLGGGTLPFSATNPPAGWPRWGVQVVRPYGATAADLVQVVALAQAGRLKATVQREPLEDAPAVLDRLDRGEIAGRAVLIP